MDGSRLLSRYDGWFPTFEPLQRRGLSFLSRNDGRIFQFDCWVNSRCFLFRYSEWILKLMATTIVDVLFVSLLLKHDGGLHSLRTRSCVGAKELGEAH